MAIVVGIFGSGSSFDSRFVPDYEELAKKIEALKVIGLTIVLTMGSFDWLHTGHYKYLELAKEYGDVLVVGVDSDIKIRARKGDRRPIIPEEERLESLTHTRHVDLLTIKNRGDMKWSLIKAVRPDVLITTEMSYTDDEIRELEKNYCGKVVILPYTKTVSTSAKLREMYLRTGSAIAPMLMEEILKLIMEHSPTLIEQALRKTDQPRTTETDTRNDD